MKIILKNCNNIDEAKIDIKENELNIKYAINGTGKSTIANAIRKKVGGEELASLQPFKFLNDGEEGHKPSVEIESEEEIRKVLILATYKPHDEISFISIFGLDKKKYDLFGEGFIQIILKHDKVELVASLYGSNPIAILYDRNRAIPSVFVVGDQFVIHTDN